MEETRITAMIPTVINHTLTELTDSTREAELSVESKAALRQFSHHRLMGYGVEYGDAIRVRHAVESGVNWMEACVRIADSIVAEPTIQLPSGAPYTRRDSQRLYRASALLRMAQMMMLENSDTRVQLYRRASKLFAMALGENPGWSRILIPTDSGTLVTWGLPSNRGDYHKVVVAIGGVEGWAMDAEPTVRELRERGFALLLLDGPGQGESRFDFETWLGMRWKADVSKVIDFLVAEKGAAVIGILGNSMGGNFAMQYASYDARIAACCNNGALLQPLAQMKRASFFSKMSAFCSKESDVVGIWDSLEMRLEGLAFVCPLLIVQGGADPLVSVEESKRMLEWSRSADKQMHVFQDSVHCIYDKPTDKVELIADWFASRL
jgi:alpha-beta hydrolase superfamily lysophospholipase